MLRGKFFKKLCLLGLDKKFFMMRSTKSEQQLSNQALMPKSSSSNVWREQTHQSIVVEERTNLIEREHVATSV
jgi:hypothetical protein